MRADPQTFTQFWPYYLNEHRRPATRALHYVGTGLAAILIPVSILLGDFRIFLAAVVSGYAFAWVAHLAIERNRPATFRFPAWSLVADWRMFFLFVTRRLTGELRRHGIV